MLRLKASRLVSRNSSVSYATTINSTQNCILLLMSVLALGFIILYKCAIVSYIQRLPLWCVENLPCYKRTIMSMPRFSISFTLDLQLNPHNLNKTQTTWKYLHADVQKLRYQETISFKQDVGTFIPTRIIKRRGQWCNSIFTPIFTVSVLRPLIFLPNYCIACIHRISIFYRYVY